MITPTIFTNYFQETAKKYDVSLEDEYEIAKNLLEETCTQLSQLESQTTENVKQLDRSTTKAIKAKDETTLHEVLQETEQLRAEVEKLKAAVYKDALTQAYNRKWLQDHYLNQDATNHNHLIKDGVLGLIDLNYFKQINDTYGHIVGDKVLQYVTNMLRTIRYPVVRYGGNEFLILFHHSITTDIAKEELSKLRENILKKKFKVQNGSFHISFSFGLSSFSKDTILEEVLEQADQDMYSDKIQIKKRVTGI